ncbi:MAG TPA: ABC transporter ATP-binding protein [Acidimicrobiales bacterium]|nr:ABC transporter ATP-binding protein [Acidimicrobiales bacterium]
MSRILDIRDLAVRIDMRHKSVTPVDGVTLHIDAGETLGIVGESGCGKSMTGLSIMQLLPPGGHIVNGSVEFMGRDLAPLNYNEMHEIRGNDIAMIFQDPMTSLNPTKTIGEQVAEPVRIHRGANHREALDRAVEVLGLVGLPRPKERLGDYPHQLSGGMRQRVMIAMALACDPKLLIADEPTTALDVTIQAQILELLGDLKEKLGMAVLLITHDMGVIAGRTDRVMVMYAGKAVESCSTEALFDEMRHPYSQALLASIPRLEQDNQQRLYSIPGLPPDLTNPPVGCRFAPRCERATDRCRSDEPPLTGPSDAHTFACWHPIDGPLDMSSSRRTAGQVGESHAPVILEVKNLVKEFPVSGAFLSRGAKHRVHAVSDVSFSVRQGETFGLVGESGCGKTTVGRLVTALETSDSGAIEFNGEDITKFDRKTLRAQRRNFQLMFQDPYASLDPRMRVGAILREPLAIQGIGSREEQNEIIQGLLADVGLAPDAVDRYAHEFSGGQRQRIGLARALALNPRLVVADEPVSALDVSIRSQVLNLMRRLQSTHDLTYIVISHDLAVVKYLADTIGVMYLGKMVEIGPSEAIYEHPVHPYTARLIEAIPIPSPEFERTKGGHVVRGELPSALEPPSGCRFRTRCDRAQGLCADEEPMLRTFGPKHVAACHFPLEHVAVGIPTTKASSEVVDPSE